MMPANSPSNLAHSQLCGLGLGGGCLGVRVVVCDTQTAERIKREIIGRVFTLLYLY